MKRNSFRHKKSKRHKLLMDKKLKDNKESKKGVIKIVTVEKSVAAPTLA